MPSSKKMWDLPLDQSASVKKKNQTKNGEISSGWGEKDPRKRSVATAAVAPWGRGVGGGLGGRVGGHDTSFQRKGGPQTHMHGHVSKETRKNKTEKKKKKKRTKKEKKKPKKKKKKKTKNNPKTKKKKTQSAGGKKNTHIIESEKTHTGTSATANDEKGKAFAREKKKSKEALAKGRGGKRTLTGLPRGGRSCRRPGLSNQRCQPRSPNRREKEK